MRDKRGGCLGRRSKSSSSGLGLRPDTVNSRAITAHYFEQYLKKVDLRNHLRLEYTVDDFKVVPYSMLNAWNDRARYRGLPDQVLTCASGNTLATNVMP